MALEPCQHVTSTDTGWDLACDASGSCQHVLAASRQQHQQVPTVLWPPALLSARCAEGDNEGGNETQLSYEASYAQPVELAALLEGCTYAPPSHPAQAEQEHLRHGSCTRSMHCEAFRSCSAQAPQGPPLPYLSTAGRRTSLHVKIHGIEPEHLPREGPGLQELLHHLGHRQCQGLGTLAGVSVRAGCVELTLEYIATGEEEPGPDTIQLAAAEPSSSSPWSAAALVEHGSSNSSNAGSQHTSIPTQATAGAPQGPGRQVLSQHTELHNQSKSLHNFGTDGCDLIVHGTQPGPSSKDAHGLGVGEDASAELVSQLLREFQGAPWSRWLADAEEGLPTGSSVEIQVEHEGRVYVCEVSLPGLLRHAQQQQASLPPTTTQSTTPMPAPATAPLPAPRPSLTPLQPPALQPYKLSSAVVVSAVCPCALVCLPTHHDALSVPWSVQPSAPVHVLMRLATRRSALRSIPALQSTQGVRFLARGQGQDVPVRLQLLPAGPGSQETPLHWRKQQQETAALLLAQHTKPASLPGRNRGQHSASQTAASTAAHLRARRIAALTSALNTGTASQAWRTVEGALGPAQPLDDVVYTLWCLTLDVSALRPPCSLVLEVKAGTVLLDTQPLVLLEPSTASLAPELHELVTSSPGAAEGSAPVTGAGKAGSGLNNGGGVPVPAHPATTDSCIPPVPSTTDMTTGKEVSNGQGTGGRDVTPTQLRVHSWPAARQTATPLASTISLGRQVQSQRLAAAARSASLPPVPMYGLDVTTDDSADSRQGSVQGQLSQAETDKLVQALQEATPSPQAVRNGAGSDTARALLKDLGTWFEYVSACNSSGVSDNPLLAGDTGFGYDRPQLNLTKSGSIEAARVLGSRLSTLSMAAAIKDRAFQRAAVRVGCTLLHYSVSAGWPETATRLLSTLLGPAGGCTFADIRYNHGSSLLHKALASGRAGMVRSVVSWGQQFGERWSWPDSIAQLQSCLAAGQELLRAPSAGGPMPTVPETAAVDELYDQARQHSSSTSSLFDSPQGSVCSGGGDTEQQADEPGMAEQQLQPQGVLQPVQDNQRSSPAEAVQAQQQPPSLHAVEQQLREQLQQAQQEPMLLKEQLQQEEMFRQLAPARGVDTEGSQGTSSSASAVMSEGNGAAEHQQCDAELQSLPSEQHDAGVAAGSDGDEGYHSCEEEQEEGGEGQQQHQDRLQSDARTTGRSNTAAMPSSAWLQAVPHRQHSQAVASSSRTAAAHNSSGPVKGAWHQLTRGVPLPQLLHSAWFGFAQAPVETLYAYSSVQWQLLCVWACMVMCMVALSMLRSGLFGRGFSELPGLLIWVSPYPLLYVVASRQWTKMLPTALLACWTARWFSVLSIGLELVQCPEAMRMMMYTGLVYIADPFLYTLVERLSLPYLAVLRLPYALAYILLGHRLRIPYATSFGLAMCIAGVCMGATVDITSRWLFCMRHDLDGSGLPLDSSAAASRHLLHGAAVASSHATTSSGRRAHSEDAKAMVVNRQPSAQADTRAQPISTQLKSSALAGESTATSSGHAGKSITFTEGGAAALVMGGSATTNEGAAAGHREDMS